MSNIKYDSNLDEFGNAQVWLNDGNVYISETDTLELFPQQALALLQWLKEHEAELRREEQTA